MHSAESKGRKCISKIRYSTGLNDQVDKIGNKQITGSSS